jgi:hypothetical protein
MAATRAKTYAPGQMDVHPVTMVLEVPLRPAVSPI